MSSKGKLIVGAGAGLAALCVGKMIDASLRFTDERISKRVYQTIDRYPVLDQMPRDEFAKHQIDVNELTRSLYEKKIKPEPRLEQRMLACRQLNRSRRQRVPYLKG